MRVRVRVRTIFWSVVRVRVRVKVTVRGSVKRSGACPEKVAYPDEG